MKMKVSTDNSSSEEQRVFFKHTLWSEWTRLIWSFSLFNLFLAGFLEGFGLRLIKLWISRTVVQRNSRPKCHILQHRGLLGGSWSRLGQVLFPLKSRRKKCWKSAFHPTICSQMWRTSAGSTVRGWCFSKILWACATVHGNRWGERAHAASCGAWGGPFISAERSISDKL